MSVREVTRRVVISQTLFASGHTLTSGAFLSYFFSEFGPTAFAIALLQILPDTLEVSGLSSRWLAKRLGGRKRLWLITFLIARSIAMVIPLSLLWEFTSMKAQPQVFILSCVGLWHLFQGISFVTYLSWIADLVPEVGWGRFFSSRKLAELGVQLILGVSVALLRSYVLQKTSHDWAMASYAVIFFVGGLLCIASMWPLLKLPDAAPVAAPPNGGSGLASMVRQLREQPAFLWLLAHGWWLSAFQGLTQAVLFKFRVYVLGISLETFLILNGLMLLVQIPLSVWAGRLCDAGRDWEAYIWSLLIVSCAMFMYLSATAGTWWLLILAHLLFGMFGMVNVCNLTVALKLAPPHDNMLHLSMLRQVGGLLAGVAGLLGGWWLDQLVRGAASSVDALDHGCRLLMLISWAGRVTAIGWLLPLAWGFWRGASRLPSHNAEDESPPDGEPIT
ncbi:MAG: hypothetical protein KDA58_11310 [Planctomycetaceae bacterium]|nr:hypothetical protein [Planctomycetaceae bacterium]